MAESLKLPWTAQCDIVDQELCLEKEAMRVWGIWETDACAAPPCSFTQGLGIRWRDETMEGALVSGVNLSSAYFD